MQLKKICIKVLAILMAVTIAVTTPLSDFADIKGVKDSHAVASAPIGLGTLFGALAGLYGIYVATDKLPDMAESWLGWTAENDLGVYGMLTDIKQGLTEYTVKKALISSVGNYLATLEPTTVTTKIKAKVIEPYNTLDVAQNYSAFKEFYETEVKTSNDILIYNFGNNFYVLRPYTSNLIVPSSSIADTLFLFNLKEENKAVSAHLGLDSSGTPIVRTNNTQLVQYRYLFENNEWSKWGPYDTSCATVKRYFEQGYPMETMIPLSFVNVENLATVPINELYSDHTFELDYSVHGNNALDNTDALDGQTVTQAQLEAIQQAVEKEYSNVVQFPGNNEDNENNEEPDVQGLSNAITLAVLSTLQNMGYIENPTDEPSGEDVKQQLGKIEIAVDGMTDAMAQNNRLLENVFDAVQGLASNIGNAVSVAFQNALDALFVPDTEAVENLTNDFFDKFPWTHTLFDYTDDIKKAFLSSEPPKIYIHFQDSKDSKYHSIGTQLAFDASWYAPYKPTGDMILSVFIYALFLWRLFKNIPNIMSGLGMMTDQSTRFEDNMVKNGKG